MERVNIISQEDANSHFGLDQSDASALKQRIAAARGLVDILVHPFFEETIEFPSWASPRTLPARFPPNPRSSAYFGHLHQMLEKKSELPALFVFEETKILRNAIKYAEKNLHIPITFVPTKSGYSTPNLHWLPSVPPLMNVTHSEHWRRATAVLKSIGVTRARIGGQKLNIYDAGEQSYVTSYSQQRHRLGEQASDKYDLSACVGSAVKYLCANGIEAELMPNITYPELDTDIQQFDPSYRRRIVDIF